MMIEQKKMYRITGFNNNCPKSYMHRLLSFGFIPGEQFCVVKKSFFGNPYLIKIKSFSVALRKSELNLLKFKLA